MRGPSVTGFSFDAVDADDYERLRPGYSEDAVAWLLTTAPSAHDGLVADVAAGTGKLTRMLAERRRRRDCILLHPSPVTLGPSEHKTLAPR